ncbi:MAG: hypothetical protein JXR71_08685 [Bacteroidales bacterium]|nr:hypothetical protein [Bacteroidales bacterium]
MKKYILLMTMIFTTGFLMAQEKGQYSMGSTHLNFGPVYAGVDFTVQDNITVGPVVTYDWSYYDSNLGEFRAAFNLSGKADYHFGTILGLPEQWDLYGGVRVGVGFGSKTRLLSGVEIGGRWFWNDKWGLNVESVYGNYWGGNVGVTMKLK